MRSPRRFVPVLAIALIGAAVLAGQGKNKEDSTVRTLEGTVVDTGDKPVAKAIVQLKDTRTLQVRTFISQDNGDYRFSGLRTDTDYEVKAEREGMSSRTVRLSSFDNRKTASIILKLDKK